MIIDELFEGPQLCPECGGISFSDLILAEKKDACYHKVKASAKVWPSAYASGRLVQCRKKGAANYGNKSEGVAEGSEPQVGDAVYYGKRLVGWFKGYSEHGKIITEPNYEEMGDEYANRDVYWDPQDKITITPEQGVAEAPLPGQRRGPLDLPPLEGPGSGGGSGGGPSRSGPSPFTPVKIPGTNINIPGVTQSTSPPPVVTKPPNINRQIDPVSDVPAYVRRGFPDPVTTPVGKPKITVRPGETQSQAMQRTKAEQEFGKFLQGQGGQSFGTAGAGRSGQGGPTATQTSGSNQVPTVTLPGGQTVPDPARLSPSGQYSTQSGRKSIDQIERDDKRAVDAMANRARQSVADREARIKVQPSWKNRDTDVDLEEESRKKRKEPEVNYDAIDHDKSVERLRHLAGLGPLKTVWDPARRVYKNVPTAQQPKK